MNNAEIKTGLTKVMTSIQDAFSVWIKKQTPQYIRETVRRELDKHHAEILRKLLGFDKNWNKWELDHCNGRKGESTAGDYLRRHQLNAVMEWLEQVELPKVTAEMERNLKKEFRQDVNRALSRKLEVLADEFAEKEAEKLIKKYTKNFEIDSQLDLQHLLTEKDKE